MLPGPKPIQNPEKELRFTRNAQAQFFYLVASILLVIGVLFIAIACTPASPIAGWLSLIPLIGSSFCAWLGLRCQRFAYVLFTPMGIEIFPFFRARDHLQVIYWAQIHALEVKKKALYIHYNAEKTAGVVVSLAPLFPTQRELLEATVDGLIQKGTLSKYRERTSPSPSSS